MLIKKRGAESVGLFVLRMDRDKTDEMAKKGAHFSLLSTRPVRSDAHVLYGWSTNRCRTLNSKGKGPCKRWNEVGGQQLYTKGLVTALPLEGKRRENVRTSCPYEWDRGLPAVHAVRSATGRQTLGSNGVPMRVRRDHYGHTPRRRTPPNTNRWRRRDGSRGGNDP